MNGYQRKANKHECQSCAIRIPFSGLCHDCHEQELRLAYLELAEAAAKRKGYVHR